MIIEALIIGLCIILAAGMVCNKLYDTNDTLQRILKRWAALENSGIFPANKDDETLEQAKDQLLDKIETRLRELEKR